MVDFLGNIPNPMYKYRDWNNEFHRRILTHNEVYLASPDQFNDPYDATLPFRYKDEDMTPDKIFLKLLQIGEEYEKGLSPAELHSKCWERQNSGAFENGNYWKENYADHKKQMNEFGIFSTTTKKDNLLMWAHYTDSHKGFCVGFDKFILFETIFATLTPVIYGKELPTIPLLEDDPHASSLIRILATKSEDWKYEDEYRIILQGGARKTFILPDQGIKEVILGLKMTEGHKDEITEVVTKRLPHINIYQTDINLELFKLNMIPILKT